MNSKQLATPTLLGHLELAGGPVVRFRVTCISARKHKARPFALRGGGGLNIYEKLDTDSFKPAEGNLSHESRNKVERT